MLVYANKFVLEPKNGAEQIIQLVARWVGQHAKQYIDTERLAEGIRELRLCPFITCNGISRKESNLSLCFWRSTQSQRR